MTFSFKTLLFISSWLHVGQKIFCRVLDKGTIYVPENKPYNLRCQNKVNGTFASVVWLSTAYSEKSKIAIYSYSAAKKVYISPNFKRRITRYNETSLHIINARIKDSGNWECNILFKQDRGVQVQELAVYDVVVVSPPQLAGLHPRKLISKPEGKKAEVFCEVQSYSPFNMTWYKLKGNFTEHVVFRSIEHKQNNTYIKRQYMTIDSISKMDTGQYMCHAYNLGGKVSEIVTVRMQTPPVIISKSRFHINVYDSGDLLCEAKGYPEMSFEWKFILHNYKISLSARDVSSRFSVSFITYDSVTKIGSSRLTIKDVEKQDMGFYTCVAQNIVGSAQKKLTLSGFAPPDQPVIQKFNIVSSLYKIKLSWKLGSDGGKPVREIMIQYRNSSSDEDWTTLRISQLLSEYTIMNLLPQTSYDFRVLAINEVGNGRFSSIVNMPTQSLEVKTEKVLGLGLTSLLGIFAGAFIALICGFICVCIFVRRMKKHEGEEVNRQQHSANTLPPQHSVDGMAVEMEPLMRSADEWEFPRDRLTITTVLGAGAFGIVMRGLAKGIKGSVGQVNVAVKMVRENNNDIATKDLSAELNLLKLIPEHSNVLGLLGCCTISDPLYVIVEYCANGDLQGFLRSSRGVYERYYRTSYGGAIPDLTSKMLLTFASQITKGMAHLSAMKVIHRDLAARNILVDDQLVCKVSDFGFARDVYIEDHYLKRSAGGRFPIKWMAIESLLDGISTTKSDVWAFGVVLWELVTLGASPYPGMNSYEVVSFLQDGYRMDKPKHCSNEVYSLMMNCWVVSPGRRPSFNGLTEMCQNLIELSSTKELINMGFYQDHLYVNFDVNGSTQSASTTPHGTLRRSKDRVNVINGGTPIISRNVRSNSHGTVVSGRSNSVTALSERSNTGMSGVSYGNERVALLQGTSR